MARTSVFDTVAEVSKTSKEKANEKKVIWIDDKDIIDNPDNDEDITYTEDIEAGIKLQGFSSELIVTDFGMPEGKYMIVSGHRRRAAGRKCGYNSFPCIIRHYDNAAMMFDALLMYNATRNTDQDPLLYAKRFKQHMKALEMIGFKGSKREEVAKRLGISVKQADKYNTFNSMIPAIWSFVREGKGAMDGLCTLSTESEDNQRQIVELLNNEFSINGKLSVSTEKIIIQQFRGIDVNSDKKIMSQKEKTSIEKEESRYSRMSDEEVMKSLDDVPKEELKKAICKIECDMITDDTIIQDEHPFDIDDKTPLIDDGEEIPYVDDNKAPMKIDLLMEFTREQYLGDSRSFILTLRKAFQKAKKEEVLKEYSSTMSLKTYDEMLSNIDEIEKILQEHFE